MPPDPPPKPLKPHQDKLAQALRANLRRRKAASKPQPTAAAEASEPHD